MNTRRWLFSAAVAVAVVVACQETREVTNPAAPSSMLAIFKFRPQIGKPGAAPQVTRSLVPVQSLATQLRGSLVRGQSSLQMSNNGGVFFLKSSACYYVPNPSTPCSFVFDTVNAGIQIAWDSIFFVPGDSGYWCNRRPVSQGGGKGIEYEVNAREGGYDQPLHIVGNRNGYNIYGVCPDSVANDADGKNESDSSNTMVNDYKAILTWRIAATGGVAQQTLTIGGNSVDHMWGVFLGYYCSAQDSSVMWAIADTAHVYKGPFRWDQFVADAGSPHALTNQGSGHAQCTPVPSNGKPVFSYDVVYTDYLGHPSRAHLAVGTANLDGIQRLAPVWPSTIGRYRVYGPNVVTTEGQFWADILATSVMVDTFGAQRVIPAGNGPIIRLAFDSTYYVGCPLRCVLQHTTVYEPLSQTGDYILNYFPPSGDTMYAIVSAGHPVVYKARQQLIPDLQGNPSNKQYGARAEPCPHGNPYAARLYCQ